MRAGRKLAPSKKSKTRNEIEAEVVVEAVFLPTQKNTHRRPRTPSRDLEEGCEPVSLPLVNSLLSASCACLFPPV